MFQILFACVVSNEIISFTYDHRVDKNRFDFDVCGDHFDPYHVDNRHKNRLFPVLDPKINE